MQILSHIGMIHCNQCILALTLILEKDTEISTIDWSSCSAEEIRLLNNKMV